MLAIGNEIEAAASVAIREDYANELYATINKKLAAASAADCPC